MFNYDRIRLRLDTVQENARSQTVTMDEIETLIEKAEKRTITFPTWLIKHTRFEYAKMAEQRGNSTWILFEFAQNGRVKDILINRCRAPREKACRLVVDVEKMCHEEFAIERYKHQKLVNCLIAAYGFSTGGTQVIMI